MVVFSPFVLLLCTLWEFCARFLIYILLFTDQKKKNHNIQQFECDLCFHITPVENQIIFLRYSLVYLLHFFVHYPTLYFVSFLFQYFVYI